MCRHSLLDYPRRPISTIEYTALIISLQFSNQTQGAGVLSGRGGFEGSDSRSYKPNIVWGMQAVLELC